ncbi:hypothetical protein GCM10007924_07550 [Sneathiella chinensis]|uniref:Uncharacterized protein n=1 Tax=Sneathiella chinensis TaxID=349750 RepID=A0ABQ5U0Z7_9PROT|nr:hypothetical protein GCM10007924_07550 [Sneathiella chinensis]
MEDPDFGDAGVKGRAGEINQVPLKRGGKQQQNRIERRQKDAKPKKGRDGRPQSFR